MLLKSLKARFGFDQFLKGQQEVVERIVAGQSAVAIFPTGAGKSLCYQLPALHLCGLTLVVSPLLSLMKDQLDFLLQKKIPAAKLDSGMTPAAFQQALDDARNGRVKILMISVERFKNERFRAHLAKMNVSLLVVDEAHCISEWGHNFRPDYLKIPVYRTEFGIGQVLLLTATATPEVVVDMRQKFVIPAENVTVTGFYRQNLQLEVRPSRADAKDRSLLETLARPPAGPAIVYVTLQKTAETVAATLAAGGISAAAYHAGMDAAAREAVQNGFMDGAIRVVTATIAFGMGIDKGDIRKVIHYDLPKSIEGYSQEIGRAGRDGTLSVCTVLGNRGDVPVLENFAYGDTPEKDGIRRVLEAIEGCAGRRWEVRLYELSRETDIRLLPLKTLLVYLELEGVIRPQYSYFESYPFKLLLDAQTIVEKFAGPRRGFVETIFSNCRTARVWSEPDIAAIMEKSGSDRNRVLAALDYFDGQGWIELKPKTSVEVYAILDAGFDPPALAERLHARFQRREAHEIRRIADMVALFEDSDCLARALSAYFGETIEGPCKRCSACRTGAQRAMPAIDRPPLPDADFQRLIDPLAARLEARPTATQATRFLCGISTPGLVRAQATRLAGFGRLGGYPYPEVAAWVEKKL